eukprot:TRINITY_DN69926_c0_g1_i1.p1 TRINITY_DN69926_c0_g1~~TRINITY_DN69926_c0_g1_i1.p1  ORF type:complete len:325 (-),score=35.84 TRINITY_DN69926_c0_g1_i1:70-1044(-)
MGGSILVPQAPCDLDNLTSSETSFAPLVPTDLDLSMEVMEWLKDIVVETDREWTNDTKIRAAIDTSSNWMGASAWPWNKATSFVPMSSISSKTCDSVTLRRRRAAVAVTSMVATLRRFYPDMPPDILTHHVHNAVYTGEILRYASEEFHESIRSIVPLDRRDWQAEIVTDQVLIVTDGLSISQRLSLQTAGVRKNPAFLNAVVCGGGCAVLLGAVGAPVGAAAGATTGVVVGIVPSFFTFGLALPTFAVVGGFVGSCSGVVAGASVGLVGGSTLGGLGTLSYRFHNEIHDAVCRTMEEAKGRLRCSKGKVACDVVENPMPVVAA